MTRYVKTTLTAAIAALALTAASAIAQSYPSDFAALDADNNGQVSFAEYSAVTKASGLTTTAAAQQFTRISAGDAIITEDEFNLALAFQDQPYALQNFNNETSVSFVAAPDFEPPVNEVQDAPVMDTDPIETEEAPAPEVEIIREAVPKPVEPTIAVTEPEVMEEAPDSEMAEPEETGDVLMEEEAEPLPEG